MALRINFDTSGNPELSTFILAHKDGRIIGELSHVSNVKIRGSLKDAHEISFVIHKMDNDVVMPYWDDVVDFRLVLCKEWKTWFEMTVSKNENDESVKNVNLIKLGDAELSQIRIYDTEINTENDIARDDYVEPTILYNPSNPDASLTHRLMKDKAPHYTIRHVDDSIKGIQRTYTFNDKSLKECFDEIAEEIDALIVYDSDTDDIDNNITVNRTISIYDMLTSCRSCGHRADFNTKCPECGSNNIYEGYGVDTTICIDKECLGNEMTIDIDADAVKNCYRLSAGDDCMTATVKSCNPNGSSYIWHVSEDEKRDMPTELVKKLDTYRADYTYYQKTYSPSLTSAVVNTYNTLVDKYVAYYEDLPKVGNIVGYPKIMETMWNALDFKMFLQYSLMPSAKISNTSAEKQVELLTESALSPIALTNLNYLTKANVSNAILSYAKILVDKRYQVKIKQATLYGTTWQGILTVTNYSDSEDTADSNVLSVVVSDNYETYIKQRLKKRLENTTYSGNISDLFDLSLDEFKVELQKYGLNSLSIFNDVCQACIDILDEQGISNNVTWANQTPNMYNLVYVPYINKLEAIQSEIMVRESEINSITDVYNQLDIVRTGIQGALNLESYLGTYLWHVFCAYRREETYSNDNCISDGLNNAEMFKRAYEMIQDAEAAIQKVSSYRHQISTSMKNLLVIEEFEPLKEHFEIGNWIRVKDNDENIYKLRLLDYEIDFNDLSDISVTFSDAIKIVDKFTAAKNTIVKTSSIIKNYNSTIQNTLNKYEILNDRMDTSETNSNLNNNNMSDNMNGKVDKEGIIDSINSSKESGKIAISRLDLDSLFKRMFTVSKYDISVGSSLDTNHIYIYYDDGTSSNGSSSGSGSSGSGSSGGDSGSENGGTSSGGSGGTSGGGTVETLPDGYLYSYGTTSPLVGGWNTYKFDNIYGNAELDAVVVEESDCLYMYKPYSAKTSVLQFFSQNAIDITGYTTLNVTYSYISTYNITFMMGFGDANNHADWTQGKGTSCNRTSSSSEVDTTMSISLDDVEKHADKYGNLYLYIWYHSSGSSLNEGELKIKEIWLE